MKKLLAFGFVLASLTTFGQTTAVFKNYVKPGKVYRTVMKTSSETEIDFSGNPEVIEQIKASGTKLPMLVGGTSEMSTTITTDKLTPENTFKARTVFGKVTATQSINGKEKVEEKPLSGLIIESTYDEQNHLEIDTMISSSVDDRMKQTMKLMMENIQQQIKFPEKPMQVGDTFSQEVPMQIPLPGLNPVKMVINTTYLLKSIDSGIATFDIAQTMTLDMENQQGNISASGKGTGVSEFDIGNSTTTKYEVDLIMTMNATIEELVMTAKMTSKTIQHTTVD